MLIRLWRRLTPKRQYQFGLLLVLMLLASFAEILSIGAVLPFLAVLTMPERVFAYPIAKPLFEVFSITAPGQLLLPLTVVFAVAVLLAGVVRLCLVWATIRLSFAAGADLSIDIYKRTLYQPYALHVARNSSEVITGIASKVNDVIYSVMTPTLMLISACFMLLAILLALLSINPVVALSVFGGFGLIYFIVIKLTRKRQALNSQRIATDSTQVIKSLQEGLGGIRDVLIDGSQKTYCDIYRSADSSLRRSQGNNQFIGIFPRYGIETLGMLLISAVAFFHAREPEGLASTIPVLGALALGAQRLLPVLQQAYGGWTSIRGGKVSLLDVLELLEQPLPAYVDQPYVAPLPFSHQIELSGLSFRYAGEKGEVLSDLNLTIRKGERIGIIGETGCGKSSLLDIVMGLLEPSEGALKIDGVAIKPENCRAWQMHIAHVPQAIFLADATIEENIAFGIPKDQIDPVRVRQAARQAKIAETIESWPRQYQTDTGERGVRLSGGQRQRIGIARALYKRADVIILDEATSALDNETELAVMQAIQSLGDDLTILIIAHRLSTLKSCSRIVELCSGKIKRVGSYQEIVPLTS